MVAESKRALKKANFQVATDKYSHTSGLVEVQCSNPHRIARRGYAVSISRIRMSRWRVKSLGTTSARHLYNTKIRVASGFPFLVGVHLGQGQE
jgi:hypothetical protein